LPDFGGSASTALDLRPPGDPGFDVMTKCIFRQQLAVVVVMGDGMWAWTYERHVAAKNIEKLRQFVNAGSA
jgi:hypothetical protein